MLYIHCPNCGLRNEDEFIYGDDARHRRPQEPAKLSDREWCDYIYTVPNTKGWVTELWWHVRGCRRWVTVRRNTETNELRHLPSDRQNV